MWRNLVIPLLSNFGDRFSGKGEMARGELMKKLLASYGRDDEFRAVAEQIITEEEAKNNKVLARSLRRSLEVAPPKASRPLPAAVSPNIFPSRADKGGTCRRVRVMLARPTLSREDAEAAVPWRGYAGEIKSEFRKLAQQQAAEQERDKAAAELQEMTAERTEALRSRDEALRRSRDERLRRSRDEAQRRSRDGAAADARRTLRSP